MPFHPMRQKRMRAADDRARILSFLFCLTLLAASLIPTILAAPSTDLPRALVNPAALAQLPPIIERDLREGKIPGAVVLIGQRDQILFQQSFGSRAWLPQAEAMTDDTIFDLASLTKVVATTTAILQLVEQGKLQLDAPAARYWPAFGAHGKEAISVRQLLTHYSGLRADIPVRKSWQGYAGAMQQIVQEAPVQTPGSTYLYSDINFSVLGELVRRVSGQSLPDYCASHIFAPLNMRETRFNPPQSWRDRIAPTVVNHGDILRGVIHDPVARHMGGVSGHAGLFSTAADLSRFARMLLNDGELDGARILGADSVRLLRSPQSPAGQEKLRGLGWDLAAPFAANRFALIGVGAFGHTGYTGTSLWIDPVNQLYSIVLTNRVHPDDRGKIRNLRDDITNTLGDVAGAVSEKTVAAYFLSTPLLEIQQGLLTGLDVLEDLRFAPLQGKRIGLITNHTGRDHDGKSAIDIFQSNKNLKLVALFSPEHGLEGLRDERIESSIDAHSQLPVYSLYGKTLRPTPEMLKDIDVLVFDIQDAGARFYTYISTLGYAMEAAARAGIDFYVLDRPNPIGAHRVQGPLLDADLLSFTGYFPLPVTHGMTVGELARLFYAEKVNAEKVNAEKINTGKANAEGVNAGNNIGARLRVIPMQGYRRELWFDQTGLTWINPSPNLRSLAAATLYPGVAILEAANVSVGRGTSKPFELLGAPWVDGLRLTRYLHQRKIAGVDFRAVKFTPKSSMYQGKLCHGAKLILTDREQLNAPLLGIEIASALAHLYPDKFDLKGITGMIGSRATVEAIKRGEDPQTIAASWDRPLQNFAQMRNRYLLY